MLFPQTPWNALFVDEKNICKWNTTSLACLSMIPKWQVTGNCFSPSFHPLLCAVNADLCVSQWFRELSFHQGEAVCLTDLFEQRWAVSHKAQGQLHNNRNDAAAGREQSSFLTFFLSLSPLIARSFTTSWLYFSQRLAATRSTASLPSLFVHHLSL